MASTYALPASAMTHSHSHHGHIHSHSASASPSRQYSSRGLKQERSNGSLHSHSQSDLHVGHSHGSSHSSLHSRSHSHEREPSLSPYLPTPPNSNVLYQTEKFEAHPHHQSHDHSHESSNTKSTSNPYESLLNDVNVIPHDHSHHLHPPPTKSEPRSRFTNMILPFVLQWPLLHTIMAEKDSRRIFYFMR